MDISFEDVKVRRCIELSYMCMFSNILGMFWFGNVVCKVLYMYNMTKQPSVTRNAEIAITQKSFVLGTP